MEKPVSICFFFGFVVCQRSGSGLVGVLDIRCSNIGELLITNLSFRLDYSFIHSDLLVHLLQWKCEGVN